ncbi:transposase [Streptomyces sp. STD57]|uniref:transposase n=1 Tax=Streptomyces sp. STD57 TaxID=3231528 RepID=UPI00345BBB6A
MTGPRRVGASHRGTVRCGVGVFLAHAAYRGRRLIDRRLYPPASWTDDRDRCRRAGIEDSTGFETKVVIAEAMVRRAIEEKVPFGWVTADVAYGFSKGWRYELEQADIDAAGALAGDPCELAQRRSVLRGPTPRPGPAISPVVTQTPSWTSPSRPRPETADALGHGRAGTTWDTERRSRS